MTIKELLFGAKKGLKEGDVQEPEASAEFLLAEVLGISRTQLYANLEQEISSKNISKFNEYIERRKRHEPVWQIVGKVEFWGLPFCVNQDVLVPRPETELLVRETLKEIKNQIAKPRMINKKSKISILDVGTGSGTIAITLAKELLFRSNSNGARDDIKIFASDVSKKALQMAKQNAKLNMVADKIIFLDADLFNFPPDCRSHVPDHFDIICANLPYIPEEDMGGLALDIHHYEPRLALSGGAGGLVIYEEFLKQLPKYLKEGGSVFCEIGKEQGERFCQMVGKYFPKKECKIKKDLAGIDRIAIIQT